MKLALEADRGWIGENPAELLDFLTAIATAEGRDPVEFMHRVAKAAGATKAQQHGPEESRFRVLGECVSEGKTVYETAMTLAVAEIVELFQNHLEGVDVESWRKQVGG